MSINAASHGSREGGVDLSHLAPCTPSKRLSATARFADRGLVSAGSLDAIHGADAVMTRCRESIQRDAL
jgi:hypothetical protein